MPYWGILVLGPRMRNQTATLNSVTVPDYFDFRYRSSLSKAIRILSAFVILFATIWYMAGIVELTAFAGGVFAASFFPSIFGGLYLRWGTGHGAFWSMLIGMTSCIVWRFAFRLRFEALKDIHEIIPSFLVALAAYAIISALTRSKVPDSAHLDRLFEMGKA